MCFSLLIITQSTAIWQSAAGKDMRGIYSMFCVQHQYHPLGIINAQENHVTRKLQHVCRKVYRAIAALMYYLCMLTQLFRGLTTLDFCT